jgi:hypothetical protein
VAAESGERQLERKFATRERGDNPKWQAIGRSTTQTLYYVDNPGLDIVEVNDQRSAPMLPYVSGSPT